MSDKSEYQNYGKDFQNRISGNCNLEFFQSEIKPVDVQTRGNNKQRLYQCDFCIFYLKKECKSQIQHQHEYAKSQLEKIDSPESF